jgi:hypothetical protein
VAVVAAGVHDALGLRGIGNTGNLVERQRVHVGAQAKRLHLLAVPGRLAALDQTDHAGPPHAGDDLVTAELLQLLRNQGGGPMHLVEQFRMRMQVPPPGGDIGMKVGDAIDDGHYGPLAMQPPLAAAKSSGHFTIKSGAREGQNPARGPGLSAQHLRQASAPLSP